MRASFNLSTLFVERVKFEVEAKESTSKVFIGIDGNRGG